MIQGMKSLLLSLVLAVVVIAATPAVSQAKQYEEERIYDARVDGYTESTWIEEGSSALTWILLIGLGVICFSVMFKNARRTHLD